MPSAHPDSPALDAYWFAADHRDAPTLIALHGCGGLFDARGRMQRREAAFAIEARRAGYHLLLLDSFTPRDLRQICTTPSDRRPVRPADRREDLLGALRWLTSERRIDLERVALLGWSNGGSTILELAADARWPADLPRPRALVAFYPGCRPYLGRLDALVAPLKLYLGAQDNWTPAEQCLRLAQELPADGPRAVSAMLFAHARHGFDAPNSPLRERPELRPGSDGQPIRVGTDPGARQAAYRDLFEWLATRLR